MSLSPPLLDLAGVTFERDGRSIVDAVDWRVFPGERWALLGPNGSGKSTLLELAIGRQWPTGGRVERLGREYQDLRGLWRRIGLVNDAVAASIPADEPALDTVTSGCTAQLGLRFFVGLEPTEEERRRAAVELDRVGCSHLAGRPFGVLSRGERQKVLVARALVADPLLLVFDEPCVGMDPGARERFLWWLGEHLAAVDAPAVVLVTHHVEEILPAFGRTLVLRDGAALATGPTADVLTRALFESLYGARLERLERAGGR
ncbi:MAG: ABC transporter ATP-binding protein, partial [Planctomycetia bacterium]